jgi:tRNA threonylcarbamoyladenosine biosynthesis protein TsaB
MGGDMCGYAEVVIGQPTPILGLVEQALAQAGIEAGAVECVAVGLGPGSYTGIRTALAVTQGFALTGRVGAIGVSSVLALAHAQAEFGLQGEFHVAVDAQRGEFYLAGFDGGTDDVRTIAPLRIVEGAVIRELLAREARVVGPDLAEAMPAVVPRWPCARWVARLASSSGGMVAPEKLEPIYLRLPAFAKSVPPGAR